MTDAPAVCFWTELIDVYLDAKIVLVERDEDKWFESCFVLLDGILDPLSRYALRYTDPFRFARIMQTDGMWIEGTSGSENRY